MFFLTTKPLFKSIKVNVNSLNYYIKLNKIRKIDILKIDCEGNEENILKSCNRNLKNIKIIYLEILSEKKDWDKKFNKINKLLIKNKFELVKIKLLPEGSVLSTLKICDVLYHNKYFKK